MQPQQQIRILKALEKIDVSPRRPHPPSETLGDSLHASSVSDATSVNPPSPLRTPPAPTDGQEDQGSPTPVAVRTQSVKEKRINEENFGGESADGTEVDVTSSHETEGASEGYKAGKDSGSSAKTKATALTAAAMPPERVRTPPRASLPAMEEVERARTAVVVRPSYSRGSMASSASRVQLVRWAEAWQETFLGIKNTRVCIAITSHT